MGDGAGLIIDTISGVYDAQFSELLDRAFQVPSGAHFLEDFPVWDRRYESVGSEILRVGVFSGQTLVSCACARLAKVKAAPGRSLPVALIGAVATHADWRGKGLASRTVKLAVEWAEERGAAVSLLWGSEHQLYGKLGFAPCGAQVRVPLSSFLIPPTDRVQVFEDGWFPGLMRGLRSREGGLILEPEDQRWLEAHKNVRWFWTGDRQRPRAYAAFGRGIDLSGLVHEWGGEREDLLRIFGEISRKEPAAALLGGPRVLRNAGFVYEEGAIEHLCLARVSEPRAVLEAFQVIDPALVRGSTPGEWSRSLFGPLPLWIWGLDAA